VWEFGVVLWDFVILCDIGSGSAAVRITEAANSWQYLYLQRPRLHQGKHENSFDLPLDHWKRASEMGSEPFGFLSGGDYMHAPYTPSSNAEL